MNILLVRLRLIGDVVFTTPAIRAIRRHFPDSRISYVVEEEAAPIVRGNPHLDEVIVATSPRAPGRLRADLVLIQKLRAARYDLAIDFHGGPRSSLFTWASGAPRRIGFEVTGRSWMYTTCVSRPRVLRPRHSVVTQWDLLTPLGIPSPDPELDPTEMALDETAAASVERRLGDAGVNDGTPIVVVHVSAGNPFRRWPLDSFVTLVCGLVKSDPNRRIALTSGPSDAGAAATVADRARAALGSDLRNRILSVGEFNLAELRALIGRAALYIGGDSGPLHIAGTTTTPVVGLYGPTLSVRSEPWRSRGVVSEAAEGGALPCRPCDQRRCEPGDFRCLTRISAESVSVMAERAVKRS